MPSAGAQQNQWAGKSLLGEVRAAEMQEEGIGGSLCSGSCWAESHKGV